ncbi:acetyl/propionyl/methylcrotonyl-CoA carboxylase subunit alpha [Streptomyces akebiae]|uniref:biotin carboxylase n=1 Tax=Streptomyces akebiae TaxID=2865673 RepID=A0ABX8XJC4_9ACTN|nr:biotin carboxylase N-terminal domain-containing protein [Streptomyces akebiae]QYX75704.1 ATP-grasp domain-containing protein [Streptomyces akebiae]
MFDTVLIANRGEIAVRVIRTLPRLGIRAVAVHSTADAHARHVREADTAVALRPGGPADGYLDIEQIVEAALRTGAQAIHPGYGFLSENQLFARAVTDAGLAFVGPPATAIQLMGDKIRAKDTVRANGVPVVPGSSGSGLTNDQLAEAARTVGLPVLLKPSAGGGGKGMRLVRDPAVLHEEIAAARREASGAFGDDTLLVERWIDRPRHIEIQVLADTHGNVVHLGERECSLQRRHQKIVEEAPSVLLDDDTRAAMGAAAVEAARSCGYVGAGTVEFIVSADRPDEYFFMEMNTRLQVEHPVTEMVTGLDLVDWQIRIAAGEALTFGQDQVGFDGHAVEVRLYAEDPAKGFLPSGGRVLTLREPAGEGIRVDSGLVEGYEVGSTYDPMLAKVIAHGPDRETALRRLRAALDRTRVHGVTLNTGFLRRLLEDSDVIAGRLDTGLVEARLDSLVDAPMPDEIALAAALAVESAREPAQRDAHAWVDPFSVPSGWRIGGPAWTTHRFLDSDSEAFEIRVRRTPFGPALYEVSRGGGEAESADLRTDGSGGVLLTWNGTVQRLDHTLETTANGEVVHWLSRGADTWRLRTFDPAVAAGTGSAAAAGGALTAPMPGTVTLVKAAVGDLVTAGQTLLVVEAMKMEHALTAPFDGVVAELRAAPGTTVAMDETLAVVAPASDAADASPSEEAT